MIDILLAFLIAILIGYFTVSLIDREMELRFRFLFSIPMGFGITSIFYFLHQYFNIYAFQYFRWFELIVLIILALSYYNQEKPDLNKHVFKKLNNWFYLANIYAVMIFLKYFINNPMGSWDGFRIWNIKAEFLYQQSPLWKNVFSLPHFMSHGDYPMFLPSSIARLWQYADGANFGINMVFGLIFTFGLVYLLFQAIKYFKSEKVAYAVCTVFMLSDIFLVNGAAQCADIPLAMFFLSSIVCLYIYFKNQRFSSLILGLIIAGLSIWVKNEGLMFFAIYATTILGYLLFTKKVQNALSIGLITVFIALFYTLFKKVSNTPNDLILGFFVIKSYSFALDIQRYIIIFATFLSFIFKKFTIFLALILLCIKGFRIKESLKYPIILSSIIFGFMALGYLAVYVLAPHDVTWLVENSMDRIILQILPTFLFIYATVLRIGKPDSIN